MFLYEINNLFRFLNIAYIYQYVQLYVKCTFIITQEDKIDRHLVAYKRLYLAPYLASRLRGVKLFSSIRDITSKTIHLLHEIYCISL